jgi:hypothetical protein
MKAMTVADLLFGRGGRIAVGETAWARFVAREITPRFPDGLTVFDAKGQWRDPATSRMVRERSKVVTIVLPGSSPDDKARLSEIVDAYKARFRQTSVGLILRPACASF